MSCPTNEITVKNGLENTINEIALESGLFERIDQNTLRPIGEVEDIIEIINNTFGEEVLVLNQDGNYSIDLSEELVDFYYQNLIEEDTQEDFPGAFLQQDRTTDIPQADEKTLNSIKNFLEKTGVKFEEVKNIILNGKKLGANGIALPLQALIQYTQGNESLTLPEEAFHIGVELLSQKEPGLFDQLMKEISSYDIYKRVLTEYRNDPLYQNNGKPDIKKIKKEAIGKLLVQVQNGNEPKANKTFWQRIKDFLKGLFVGYRTDSRIFTDAVNVILQEDLGTIRDTLLKSQSYLAEQGFNEDQIDKIIDLTYSNITDDELRIAIGELMPAVAFENKTTNSVERLYSRFKDFIKSTVTGTSTLEAGVKTLNNSGEQLAVKKNIENRLNTNSYKDTQDVLGRMIDENGGIREVPLENKTISSTQINYDTLEKSIQERLESFESGTKFLHGVKLQGRNTSGEFDLIAITPDEKVSTFLFQEVQVEEGENLPGYESKAYRAVLDGNIKILKDLGFSKFGITRVIPINTKDEVEIGTVHTKDENKDYLLPISSSHETTGNKAIDRLIASFNGLTSTLNNRANPTLQSKEETNKELAKIARTVKAIRFKEDIEPLINQARSLKDKIDHLLRRYNNEFANGKATQDKARAFYSDVVLVRQISDTFSSISRFASSVELEESEVDPTDIRRLKDVSQEADQAHNRLEEILGDLTDLYIASPRDVTNFNNSEVIVKALKRYFSSFSKGATNATKVLYRMMAPIFQEVGVKQSQEIQKLLRLKKDYTKWSSSKGLTNKNLFDPIIKKDDKGRYQNELIDRYSPDFYKGLREAQEKNDPSWVKSSTDTVGYDKWYQAQKKEVFDEMDETYYIDYRWTEGDPKYAKKREELIEKDEQIRQQKKDQWIKRYDIKTNISLYNGKIKEFPLQKWETKEYQYIKNIPEVFNFYQHILEKNNEAAELGVLETWRSKSFLPFVRKDLVDKMVFGGKPKVGEDIIQSIVSDKGDTQYGALNSEGQVIDKIPFYYIHDLSNKIENNGEVYQDYSMVSTDLFSVMQLYSEQIIKYDTLSKVEDEIQILSTAEGLKKSLATDQFGARIPDKADVANTENKSYLDNFIKSALYGQRNVGGSWDAKIATYSAKAAKTINKAVGRKIFTEDFDERAVSAARTLDAMTRYFRLNVLGLNLPVSISNLFGTSVNGWINAGKHFSRKEFAYGEFLIMSGQRKSAFDSMLVGAMDYFLPMVSEEQNADKARQLKMSALNKFSIPELIMRVQTLSDRPVQWAIASAYLQNVMVENGELINIREYLRNSPEYQNMYDLPTEERNELKNSFENKVKALQDTRSILKTAEIVNDEFIIPGIERNSKTVYDIRERIQQITKQATGLGSHHDIRQINLTLIGRSLMLFRGWLPSLAEKRFQSLSENALGEYEWGRIRVLGNLLGRGITKAAGNLNAVINLTDKGVDLLKDEYLSQKLKYEEKTGQEFKMTEADFINMYQLAIKQQMQELAVLLALMGVLFAFKALPPDKDEDPRTKGFYKYGLRLIDKFNNELAFFYNPVEWAKMGGSGLFPATGVISDIAKATSHLIQQGFGELTGNEEIQDDAKPIKYIMKTLPFARATLPYLSVFLSEADQKDFGITPSTELQPH